MYILILVLFHSWPESLLVCVSYSGVRPPGGNIGRVLIFQVDVRG